MGENGQNGLKEQRDKRKRVQRIKNFIVGFIAIWIIISMVTSVILSIKVLSLQKQIDLLVGNISTEEPQENQAAGTDDNAIEDGALVHNNTTSEANLADETDTLKVYLTFDDGPSENTNEILDILDQYDIKATFFVNGREDEESLAAYKRIVDEGHTIGMHSYSHKYSEIYASLDAFENDFYKIHDLIYDTTGVDCKYYRFPGGSSNKVSNTDMAEFIRFMDEKGITYYDWNVASGDATSQAYTSDDLVENVMTDVVKYKTSVVLLHDAASKDATVLALPKIIEQLQEQGAEILPISEDTAVVQHVTLADTDK